MSLRRELEVWKRALDAYDVKDYATALNHFEQIAETSRVWFSMGMIKATVGLHEEAVRNFKEACSLDRYLAISYFQCGVSLFLMNYYGEAAKAFDDAHYVGLYSRSHMLKNAQGCSYVCSIYEVTNTLNTSSLVCVVPAP